MRTRVIAVTLLSPPPVSFKFTPWCVTRVLWSSVTSQALQAHPAEYGVCHFHVTTKPVYTLSSCFSSPSFLCACSAFLLQHSLSGIALPCCGHRRLVLSRVLFLSVFQSTPTPPQLETTLLVRMCSFTWAGPAEVIKAGAKLHGRDPKNRVGGNNFKVQGPEQWARNEFCLLFLVAFTIGCRTLWVWCDNATAARIFSPIHWTHHKGSVWLSDPQCQSHKFPTALLRALALVMNLEAAEHFAWWKPCIIQVMEVLSCGPFLLLESISAAAGAVMARITFWSPARNQGSPEQPCWLWFGTTQHVHGSLSEVPVYWSKHQGQWPSIRGQVRWPILSAPASWCGVAREPPVTLTRLPTKPEPDPFIAVPLKWHVYDHWRSFAQEHLRGGRHNHVNMFTLPRNFDGDQGFARDVTTKQQGAKWGKKARCSFLVKRKY